MAHSYSYEDEEYFEDEPPFFDETLAGALDNTVQLSINKALERALGPLTVHFENFACQKGWLPPIASSEEALSDQPSTSKGKARAKSWAHSDTFKKLASSIQEDHGYSFSQAQEAYGSDSDQSSSKSSSGSDSEEDLGPRPSAGKRKKSESTKAPPTKAPKVLTFSPEEIVHPRSSSWVPPPEVAEYLQKHIRASFDKDVRARLRAECPRPELEGKVTDTPDVDPTMVTFLKKWAKDPKKGLNRAWRACQDKLLDLSGPLAKILEMAYVAKELQSPINPEILVGWAQRAICHLGNANVALSTERRRSILMRIDPQRTELATSEAGPVAQGLLFGAPFIKDLAKFAATFNTMDKAQPCVLNRIENS
ncbi:hypothetical protein NDU88_003792 [Pleurodeles waltl]|uniref:Phosphoprotein n=1 Tax=Pleurodeles waltl TaxID=8319 RepID=A0AAV7MSN2_PLEWA|nr:hypothetical protein NDU88_003792 [Pleurodeles waltl]